MFFASIVGATQADKAVYIYRARIAFWQGRVLFSRLCNLGG
jgi:hypothetical protein